MDLKLILNSNKFINNEIRPSVKFILKKLYNYLSEYKNREELLKIIERDYSDESVSEITKKYISELVSRINSTKCLDFYLSLYDYKIFENILPPKYFFRKIEDDINIVLDENATIRIELKGKDFYTNEEILNPTILYKLYWTTLDQELIEILNEDIVTIIGNIILKIISSFGNQKDGEIWISMLDTDEDEDEYIPLMINVLTKNITKYPPDTIEDLLINITENKILSEFL